MKKERAPSPPAWRRSVHRTVAILPVHEAIMDAPRIFPNEDSAERLIGALLAEIHEEWQGRRYLDMSDFHEWWEAQQPSDRKEDKVVGIDH